MSARRAVRVALATGILLLPTAAVTAAPAAADVRKGTLTFTPGKGLSTTRITMYTDQSCPADTTHGYALARGKGFPSEGQTVVSNNLNNFSDSAPFSAKMQDTMAGFAAINGTQLSGRYVVTFYCVDDTNTIVYGEFTGAVTFATPKAFTAPAYVPPPAAPGPAPGASAGAGTAAGTPDPSSSAGSTSSGGPVTAPQPSSSTVPDASTGDDPAAAQAPGESSSSLFRWFVYLAGGLLMVFGAVFWWTGRPRPETAGPSTGDAAEPSYSEAHHASDATSVGSHANDPSA